MATCHDEQYITTWCTNLKEFCYQFKDLFGIECTIRFAKFKFTDYESTLFVTLTQSEKHITKMTQIFCS